MRGTVLHLTRAPVQHGVQSVAPAARATPGKGGAVAARAHPAAVLTPAPRRREALQVHLGGLHLEVRPLR